MEIKWISREEYIKQIPARWKHQYHHMGIWKPTVNNNSEEVYELLRNEDNLTEERAAEIIGNKTWSQMHCWFGEPLEEGIELIDEDGDLCIICAQHINEIKQHIPKKVKAK